MTEECLSMRFLVFPKDILALSCMKGSLLIRTIVYISGSTTLIKDRIPYEYLKAQMMAKHIVIERPNGTVTIVRSEIETASEEPLTEHEQIINELYSKVKNLCLFSNNEVAVCVHEWTRPIINANNYQCCKCGVWKQQTDC